MAESPDTISTLAPDMEKGEDINHASPSIDTQKYRNVPLPPISIPAQDSSNLTKSRKTAIATFLILCNSILVNLSFPS
jgi:hypothetical protein